jgi:O-antigen/teichoic acid export membrane protein
MSAASGPSTYRRITTAVLAMWLSRFVAIGCGLVLMPILFKRLGEAELGVWLMLNQSGLLILLLDFGLTSTLIRRFAFLRGAAGGHERTEDRLRAFGRLAGTGRLLYRFIAIGVGGAAWLWGLAFVDTFGLEREPLVQARIAWTIICVGQAIGLSNGLWTAAIAGFGYVAPVSLISIGFTSLTILAQCGVAIAGGGLVPLAVVAAAGSLAVRAVAKAYLRRKEPALSGVPVEWSRAAAADLMRPSLKFFLTEIGTLMLMRSDQYFIAAYLDPKSIPNYAAAYMLAFNASLVSIGVSEAGGVYISQFWRSGAHDRIRGIVLRSMRVGMGLMALGAALLLFGGPAIMSVWIGEDRFVGQAIMAVFSTMLLVYTQQSLLFEFSRATEYEVYALWFLLAGAMKIALSFLLTPSLGLVGVALSTLLAQATTTGWQIPLSGLRRLEISPKDYFREVAAPVAALFALACASIWLVTEGPFAPIGALPKIAASTLAGAAAGAVGFWTLVLDARLRRVVIDRMRMIAPGIVNPWR